MACIEIMLTASANGSAHVPGGGELAHARQFASRAGFASWTPSGALLRFRQAALSPAPESQSRSHAMAAAKSGAKSKVSEFSMLNPP